MRTSRFGLAALAALALIAPCASVAETPHYYVPIVWASVNEPQDSSSFGNCGSRVGTFWQSKVWIYDTGKEPRTVSLYSPLGNGARLQDPCVTRSLGPGDGLQIGDCVSVSGVAFMELSVPPDVLVSGYVTRVGLVSIFGPPFGFDYAQGTAPLPVFRGLFSVGQMTITDAVNLGPPDLPSCAPENVNYHRRKNVTLLNAGDKPATFGVAVRVQQRQPPYLVVTTAQQQYVVPPRDVVQVNGFDVPLPEVLPLNSQNPSYGEYFGWFLITADQPFLSYVSTIIDQPEPKAMPFAVYPSRALP